MTVNKTDKLLVNVYAQKQLVSSINMRFVDHVCTICTMYVDKRNKFVLIKKGFV